MHKPWHLNPQLQREMHKIACPLNFFYHHFQTKSLIMSLDLKTTFDFCVEHELLDVETAERTLSIVRCEYERKGVNTISVILGCGVDEREMYEIAAITHQLQLLTLDDLIVDKDAFNCVSLNNASQLYCIPVSVNSSELSVVTCSWHKLEVVTKGMANLSGKKIHVDLMSSSDYDNLKKRIS